MGLRAVSDGKMARGTGATASISTQKGRYETKLWWEQNIDSNSEEGADTGGHKREKEGLAVGVTEVVIFQEVWKV